MPVLTAGKAGADTLERGRRLLVNVSGNGSATVQRTYAGAVVDSVVLAAGASQQFGEYHTDVGFKVYCTAGTVSYAKAQSLAEVGSAGSVGGIEDVPGLPPVLTDLDERVTGLAGMLTGIHGGAPSTNFAGVAAISGGTP